MLWDSPVYTHEAGWQDNISDLVAIRTRHRDSSFVRLLQTCMRVKMA